MDKRKLILLIVIALVVTAIDQFTKYLVLSSLKTEGNSVRVIGNFLMLILQRNPDGVLGISLGKGWSYLVFPVVAVLIFLMSARVLPNAGFAAAYGMILGGAIGNTIDRVFRPAGVVDFISFIFFQVKVGNRWYGWSRYPTFNVADIGLVVGMLLLLLLETLHAIREKRAARAMPNPAPPNPTQS
jgi:signal peptidase II